MKSIISKIINIIYLKNILDRTLLYILYYIYSISPANKHKEFSVSFYNKSVHRGRDIMCDGNRMQITILVVSLTRIQ